jgi:hypothetical protein
MFFFTQLYRSTGQTKMISKRLRVVAESQDNGHGHGAPNSCKRLKITYCSSENNSENEDETCLFLADSEITVLE